MRRLIHTCPVCNSPAEVHHEQKWTRSYFDQKEGRDVEVRCTHRVFKCSFVKSRQTQNVPWHSESTEQLVRPVTETSNLDRTKRAYEYQVEGLEFIERSNYNCLIADEMGLGKTIQALLALKNNPDLFPVLIVVKATLKYQWLREFRDWCNDELMSCVTIDSTSDMVLPIHKAYIMSMDLFARSSKKTGEFTILKRLAHIPFKTVILDECHNFKDTGAKRTQGLLEFITSRNIQAKLMLSGTPIKNRAEEYIVPLNLLDPATFKSPTHFRRYWLDEARIKEWRLDEFRMTTEKYIIRREKKDVLPDLPSLSRTYEYVEIEDSFAKNSYNQQLTLMENALNNEGMGDPVSILGWLSKLRHETGRAKIPHIIEKAEEFLESTEDDKLCIGIHHEDVRDRIFYGLQSRGYSVLKLSGENDAKAKDRIVSQFRNGNRVLVANILAGGVGLNLQFCHNAFNTERQWTSADEEQFEGRFHRNGQKYPVSMGYLIAKGTIDQFFHEKVIEKRMIHGETVQGWDLKSDSKALREIAEQAISSRL